MNKYMQGRTCVTYLLLLLEIHSWTLTLVSNKGSWILFTSILGAGRDRTSEPQQQRRGVFKETKKETLREAERGSAQTESPGTQSTSTQHPSSQCPVK